MPIKNTRPGQCNCKYMRSKEMYHDENVEHDGLFSSGMQTGMGQIVFAVELSIYFLVCHSHAPIVNDQALVAGIVLELVSELPDSAQEVGQACKRGFCIWLHVTLQRLRALRCSF